MFSISDKVVNNYLEQLDDDVKNNPLFKPFINIVSDISALIVLEYDKHINEKEND